MKFSILFLVATFPLFTFAADVDNDAPLTAPARKAIRPLVQANIEFGGDKLLEVTYTDGSKSSVEAGRGLYLGGGAAYDLTENVELQGTIGVKFTSTKEAKNGSIDWTRVPVEALAFYRLPDWKMRFGAGPTIHVANKIKGSGDASMINQAFDTAVGVTAEAGYFFGSNQEIGANFRMTKMSYKASGFNASVKGDSLGFGISYFFM